MNALRYFALVQTESWQRTVMFPELLPMWDGLISMLLKSRCGCMCMKEIPDSLILSTLLMP